MRSLFSDVVAGFSLRTLKGAATGSGEIALRQPRSFAISLPISTGGLHLE
jgi:hypothetical protein